MHTTATLDFAQEELAGKLLHMIVTQLEGQLEPWSKVSEEKQQIALNAMSIAVEGAVREAVYVIASDRRTTLRAVVESVTFKDGIKAVLSLSKGDGGRHELADAEGGTALVIVGELDKYATGTEKVGAAPEQPGLPLSTKTADPAPVSGRDLPDRPATPQVQEAPPIPEVLKLKDGSFQVVIGKDKLHYPGSPESFKSAARAESWLTKHLDEKDSGMLAEALTAFQAAGAAEAEKDPEARDLDASFQRTAKTFPEGFMEDNYPELTAAHVAGFDKALDDDE